MQVEIAELEARREDLRVAFAQTQRRLLESQIAEAMGRLNRSTSIQAELSETQRKIDDAERDSAAADEVVQALRKGLAENNPTSTSLQLTITRRVTGQMVVLPASVMTMLRPGDVVQADFAAAPGGVTTEAVASAVNSTSK
jgi:predicted RNase H-like nuclease (RuvC/YqgF family)